MTEDSANYNDGAVIGVLLTRGEVGKADGAGFQGPSGRMCSRSSQVRIVPLVRPWNGRVRGWAELNRTFVELDLH